MVQDQSFIEIVDKHLASSDARLPVFNTTALRIQQEIAKEEPDTRLIEKLVVSDQSLTAKVLSVSNSSFYKGLQQVATVRNAIVRLGINEVSNITTLVTHKYHFRSKDSVLNQIMRDLWRHSVGCAIGSHWLAGQCGLQGIKHESFFAGLLHDVGKLHILKIADNFKKNKNNGGDRHNGIGLDVVGRHLDERPEPGSLPSQDSHQERQENGNDLPDNRHHKGAGHICAIAPVHRCEGIP